MKNPCELQPLTHPTVARVKSAEYAALITVGCKPPPVVGRSTSSPLCWRPSRDVRRNNVAHVISAISTPTNACRACTERRREREKSKGGRWVKRNWSSVKTKKNGRWLKPKLVSRYELGGNGDRRQGHLALSQPRELKDTPTSAGWPAQRR